MVTVVRNPLAYTLELEGGTVPACLALSCSLCWNIAHCPVPVRGSKQVFCCDCLMELTRTNKVNPLTGQDLPKDEWWEVCPEVDEAQAAAKVTCTFPTGETVKGGAAEMGKLVCPARTKAKVDHLYEMLTSILPKYGVPTVRKCCTNER